MMSRSGAISILLGALVLTLGVGIARQAMRAPQAPSARPARGTAPQTAPEAASPEAKSAAQVEFDALIERLRNRVQAAGSQKAREKILPVIVDALHSFIEGHREDPVADQAAMALGQLQLRMGNTPEAILTFRGLTERPRDPKTAPAARLFLAQALAVAGQTELAKRTFEEVARLEENGKSKEERKIGEAARQMLAQLSGESLLKIGTKPPAFEAADLAGKTHSPEQYLGKVLLIDFWATWCAPCRAELPNLKALYEKYRGRGFEILGISLDEQKSSLEAFVKGQGVAWPQICDGKGWRSEIARLYGVTAIPQMILVDRRGNVRYLNARGAALERAVAELVSEKG